MFISYLLASCFKVKVLRSLKISEVIQKSVIKAFIINLEGTPTIWEVFLVNMTRLKGSRNQCYMKNDFEVSMHNLEKSEAEA